MVKHRDRYLTSTGSPDDLMGLFNTVSAIGDLKTMWKELADVAPEEIRADTEAVHNSWIKAEDAAVAGDYMTLFGNALFNSAAMSRVDQYMIDHCDPWAYQDSDMEITSLLHTSSRYRKPSPMAVGAPTL